MRGGHRAELLLDRLPDGHRVDADAVAGEAGDKEIPAVLPLDQGTEAVGDLESSLVINLGGGVAP